MTRVQIKVKKLEEIVKTLDSNWQTTDYDYFYPSMIKHCGKYLEGELEKDGRVYADYCYWYDVWIDEKMELPPRPLESKKVHEFLEDRPIDPKSKVAKAIKKLGEGKKVSKLADPQAKEENFLGNPPQAIQDWAKDGPPEPKDGAAAKALRKLAEGEKLSKVVEASYLEEEKEAEEKVKEYKKKCQKWNDEKGDYAWIDDLPKRELFDRDENGKLKLKLDEKEDLKGNVSEYDIAYEKMCREMEEKGIIEKGQLDKGKKKSLVKWPDSAASIKKYMSVEEKQRMSLAELITETKLVSEELSDLVTRLRLAHIGEQYCAGQKPSQSD